MTLSIPYSFTAGTLAKSQEVNADFQAVQTEVNSIESDVASALIDISSLQNGKASVNGSASNTFSVADPVNNTDAVNKRYFSSLTKYSLFGLVINKADDEYISCTAGACYDSTGTKILQFAEDTSASEYPYNANATYYVYIIGTSAGGTNTTLLISQASDNPGMPSGYSLFRILGGFVTDASGKISSVFYLDNRYKYKWVVKKLTLSTATSGTRTLNFSSYLPNDGATYEVLLTTTWGCNSNYVGEATITNYGITVARGKHADSSNNMYFCNTYILPVTSSRSLTLVIEPGRFNDFSVVAAAYIRVD